MPASRSARRGAIAVDKRMRTNLPNLCAAGDCVVTHHRLLGAPIFRWAQPRTSRAASRARTRSAALAPFAGSLGTQVVKVFDRSSPARACETTKQPRPDSIRSPGEPSRRSQGVLPRRRPICMRVTGDRPTGQPARRPAVRTPPIRDRKTNRHRGHRHLPRHERRRDQRARPLVHTAAGQPLGRGPNGSSSLVVAAQLRFSSLKVSALTAPSGVESRG